MANIALIGYDNCLSSSISLPLEMLNAAADMHAAAQRQRPQTPKIYAQQRSIHCAGSLSIQATGHPREIKRAKLIILPAIWRNPQVVIRENRFLLPLLQQWQQSGAMLCAVGTSSSFLAAAGLLDQRPATTHWAHAELFQKRYPTVQLKKDFLITRSENLYCASSVNSVADLMIYFIEKIYGRSTAQRVESNFSPEVRQSYATNMYSEGEHARHSDEDIVRLQHWLNENHQQALKAEDMANMLGISTRTLNRRFKIATRQSPQKYLQQLRIQHAKELLKKTNLSIAEVAEQVGYHDISNFGGAFKRHMGMPPRNYRESVKSKLFSLTENKARK